MIFDKKSGTTLAKVQMAENKVFPIHLPQNKKLALQVNDMDESSLWHLRYEHLNQKGLQLLKQKDMVMGLPLIDRNLEVCEGCIYGKMHRLTFPKNSWRAKTPLELVHADIFGPTRNPSIQNKRYFLLFVDDYSRMMWIYFIDQKSDASNVFIQFNALVERQSGYMIKTLRTDREGEFIYKLFMEHCRNECIKRQLTVSRTPQHNCVAERKNRTIVEMARR